VYRLLLGAGLLYATWLGMLGAHELGHCLHAWLSGGRVVRVSIPPLRFSQTIVHPNPHELLVVWGGPVWGVVLSVGLCELVRLMRRRVPYALRFFAGFCLIANGAYIGVGGLGHAGAAGDLRGLGTPPAVMVVCGAAAVVAGLALWHRVRWLTRAKRL
jgi:hypothetical protein